MIIAILIVVGLCLGSFVNALVWRVHGKLPIGKDRSMCPKCRHKLAPSDLVPVLSWVFLRGKCRYCGKSISVQYPLVELAMAGLSVASYVWWPNAFDAAQWVVFVLWIGLLTGLLALLVYDLRWLTLPNRIIYPLYLIALAQAVITAATADHVFTAVVNDVLAIAVGGGVFYVLFQASKGKWIGGGDVRLGWLLGLVVGTPGRAVMFIFFGSLLGSLASVPLLMSGRLKRSSNIPFGPFLIAGAMITVLFGAGISHWYRHTLLGL